MNRFRSLVATTLAASTVAVFGGAAIAASPATAAPATTDPARSAQLGASYLASIQNADGSLPGFSVATSTEDAALAFAAAGGPSDSFDKAVAYLEGHIAAATSSGGIDTAGGLAKLILVSHAAGIEPNAFGGAAAENHLVDRLLATKRGASDTSHDAGLFGSQSPAYDGAFRQSLALLALSAAGVSIPADATSWLSTQQCPDNGWMSYRAHTDAQTLEACHGFDANAFTGEDSNSTALAAEALSALGATPPQGDPLDFLDAMQNPDGGFGQFAGNPTDANSTGVVLQAIVASGEDPVAGRWADAGKTPQSALLALQIGCSGAASDRGAFAFQAGEGGALSADSFATAQAVPGIAGAPLPIDPSDLVASLPSLDCTTTQGGGGSVATTTTTGAVLAHTAAQAAGATTAVTIPETGATGPGRSVVPLSVFGALLVLAGLALIAGARRPEKR